MEAAWRKFEADELPNIVTGSASDARDFFEDGWKAAIECVKEINR